MARRRRTRRSPSPTPPATGCRREGSSRVITSAQVRRSAAASIRRGARQRPDRRRRATSCRSAWRQGPAAGDAPGPHSMADFTELQWITTREGTGGYPEISAPARSARSAVREEGVRKTAIRDVFAQSATRAELQSRATQSWRALTVEPSAGAAADDDGLAAVIVPRPQGDPDCDVHDPRGPARSVGTREPVKDAAPAARAAGTVAVTPTASPAGPAPCCFSSSRRRRRHSSRLGTSPRPGSRRSTPSRSRACR